MHGFFLKQAFPTCFLIFCWQNCFSATSQILNENFYQNPAELSWVKHLSLTGGNLWINPTLKFKGESFGMRGSAVSKAQDCLPYALTAYRFTKRLVLGFNVTPSGYGHVNWPKNSIVAYSSTLTRVFYYRAGLQSSYQFTEKLALGAGINLEYNSELAIDLVLPNQGNQRNRVSDLNHTVDVGLLYKINPHNFLTAVFYSDVNTHGHGTSTLGNIVNRNLSVTVSEGSVAYLGLQHQVTDNWFLEEKIYWSGLGIQKNLDFINTTSGSYTVPTRWKNVWSYQLSTRITTIEKLALLGSIIYETNPVGVATNAIGYPLAANLFVSGGVSITLNKALSTQLIYGYGTFVPNAVINNAHSKGEISANVQAAIAQLKYNC